MIGTFIVAQKALLSILSSMQPICTKRTTIDATNYILFQCSQKELILKSTDLEIALQSQIIIDENSINNFHSFLVNGKRLYDIVKELDDIITFTIESNQIILSTGEIKLSLNIKNIDEFPTFPERIENLMQLDAVFLLALLEKVAFLIPQNNANPALNGLFLEITNKYMTMTTTDGHCLAQIKTHQYGLEQSRQWLIPKRAIIELKKIIETTNEQEIFLGICGNQLVFSGELFNFFTKLLSSSFPEYKSILNKDDFLHATIDRNNLTKTLRRSACLLAGQFISTSFNFNNNSVSISIHNKEVGKLDETIMLHECLNKILHLKFYAPYILSGINVFTDTYIKFYLNNATRPIIFETEENDSSKYTLTYLVMPISSTATQ